MANADIHIIGLGEDGPYCGAEGEVPAVPLSTQEASLRRWAGSQRRDLEVTQLMRNTFCAECLYLACRGLGLIEPKSGVRHYHYWLMDVLGRTAVRHPHPYSQGNAAHRAAIACLGQSKHFFCRQCDDSACMR
jgi:hypothetical protein